MRLGILFSGGKDSCLAMMKAMENHEVVCLITIRSRNKESFMFHTPNNSLTSMQAKAIGLPLVSVETEGQKEGELSDLKDAIIQAKSTYHVEGIITGAVRSTYQASRVQRICDELGLWCFNPLWLMDQVELLHQVVDNNISTVISGVFAFPLEKDLLGKRIDKEVIDKMVILQQKFKINPAGEGGEIETTVLDAPFFRKRIEVVKSHSDFKNHAGTFDITEARVVDK